MHLFVQQGCPHHLLSQLLLVHYLQPMISRRIHYVPFEWLHLILMPSGSLQDQDIDHLLDIGASLTMVSTDCYNKLTKPELSSLKLNVIQADATPMEIHGKAIIQIKIGSSEMQVKCVVVKMETDVIFGLDFLIENNMVLEMRLYSVS